MEGKFSELWLRMFDEFNLLPHEELEVFYALLDYFGDEVIFRNAVIDLLNDTLKKRED